ncbi:MAG: O-antigen ligase family protein [Myxococcales bacterium]|nr:O-antigen ligase family protein [Myxococcales bacterium]
MAAPPRAPESRLAALAGPAHLASLVAMGLLLLWAPLAVGTVHKPAMLAAVALGALALASLLIANQGMGKPWRGARYAWPLAVLVVMPLLQTLPLPWGLRGRLDPAGNALLTNGPPPPFTSFPLSLDPVTTRIELLRSGLALLVFLVSLNLSAGRRGQGPLLVKAVAVAAVAGVFIGIGHPLLNYDRVYGTFGLGGAPTLVGPFINPNHTAQFFELGAFSALACAFLTSDRLFRLGWMAAAGLCGAAALVTLSRGSLVGLSAGACMLVLCLPRGSDDPEARRRPVGVPVALGLVALTLGLAVALGALPILDELARTRIAQPGEKTDVWIDALKVLWAHPAGIGRGAFDRVYPAYRSLSSPVQQNFVENQPLQYLIELGWLGFALLLGAGGYVIAIVRRRLLRDRVEAALLAALVALLAHNVFDFGLETLGLRLPFAALGGVLLGRLLGGRRPSQAGPTRTWLPLAAAVAGLVTGGVTLVTAQPFDAHLHEVEPAARGALAVAAARVHPTDYFFPLAQSTAEPLREGTRSPRLAALNRATRLCPNCANVHRATATTLWQLGRPNQALVEYRIAMDLDPGSQWSILDELFVRKATHEQVASLAPQTAAVALGVSRALVHRQATGAPPRQALDHANALKADAFELALLRIQLALNEKDLDAAEKQVTALVAREPRQPSALHLHSVVEERRGNLQQALTIATRAAGFNPNDLALARQRVYLAMRLESWGELERGLEGLKRALQGGGGNVAEAYMLSAQANSQRGNTPRALRDYQTATSIDPNNIGAWYNLATTAEAGGFYTQAVDGYRAVLRLDPKHEPSHQALARIESLRQRARLDALTGGG